MKIAESTGRFPPTPKLHNAEKTPIAAKLGDDPATVADIAVHKNVKLNAHLLPIISDDKDQTKAPANNPKF